MAMKYLSIEDTANQLGLEIDDVTRIREAGELRGFADRGTWKFKAEDVEEYQRSQQADSSDDNPLDDDLLLVSDDEFAAEDSTSILDDDDDVDADQPTLVQKTVVEEAPLLDLADDSDVRLSVDDALEVDETEAPAELLADTDSDVRLISDPAQSSEGESDILTLDGDSVSDVKLEAGIPADAEPGSDSDVKLVQSPDTPVPVDLGATSIESPREVDEDLGMTEIAEDSDLVLEMSDESGISLEAVQGSGMSLEAADESGISLESVESGITLADETIGGSGIALDMGDATENIDETQLEVPVLAGGGSDAIDGGFDIDDGEDAATDTSVLLFDDEDDADDYTDTVVKKSDDIDVFEEFAEVDEDELDVVDDDIFGDDDELDDFDDVLDVDDEAFAEDEDDIGYTEVAPIAYSAEVEHEWGLGAFLPLLLTTGLMLFCGIVLFELVRSIWAPADPIFTSGVIESIGNLFGN